ncbi:hypothetical protein HUG20_04530 [Salicibibacter cibi]|uniref:Uncharacterized protein n=1 Tax=Salicibibacter cibi TaxID=2743001 RepID=A0A7T6Z9D7_9BACI|nr:hypothetical protein [Salicibibacter cibi]QQK79225.1 hypothetical protein HUG20_04530 [Salicibibacter cibi]
MQYVVSVEEESLQVILKDRNTIFFNETFTENTEGTFTFTSANRRHELRFIGKKSRGECQIKFIKNDSVMAA